MAKLDVKNQRTGWKGVCDHCGRVQVAQTVPPWAFGDVNGWARSPGVSKVRKKRMPTARAAKAKEGGRWRSGLSFPIFWNVCTSQFRILRFVISGRRWQVPSFSSYIDVPSFYLRIFFSFLFWLLVSVSLFFFFFLFICISLSLSVTLSHTLANPSRCLSISLSISLCLSLSI